MIKSLKSVRHPKKTKKQLISDLKGKGVKLIIHYSRDELHQLALENEIELTFTEPVIIPGWLGKPKGLLHVLWERGWINEDEISKYSVDGKTSTEMKIIKSKMSFKGMCYVP